MKLSALVAAGAALVTTLSAPADAQVSFTISGNYTASFLLPTAPKPPADFVGDGVYFALPDVAGTFGGVRGTADLTFFNSSVSGGLLISRRLPDDFVDYLFDANNAQLYVGTEAAPIFRPGTFRLSGLSTPGNFTVVIASIPEPASWAMMIGGFVMVGGALRYRRRVALVRFHA